jgi:hypothetical protein
MVKIEVAVAKTKPKTTTTANATSTTSTSTTNTETVSTSKGPLTEIINKITHPFESPKQNTIPPQTETQTIETTHVYYNPFESEIAKKNKKLAETFYEKRTGVTVTEQPMTAAEILKETLASGHKPQTGEYQKTQGGPILTMTNEQNARLNAERDIKNARGIDQGIRVYNETSTVNYSQETSRLENDITASQLALNSNREWLKNYPAYINSIQHNITTIRQGPQDAQWQIDLNADNVITQNEIFTKEKALAFYESQRNQVFGEKQTVEQNIIKTESDIRDLTTSKVYLQEYQQKGYMFGIKNNEYVFSEPKASEVVNALYGDNPNIYFAQEMRSLGVGYLFASGQQLITGAPSIAAEHESSAESILGSRRKPGESIENYTARFWTSPEAIGDVWVPVITLGTAKGITLLARGIGPSIVSAGSKIAAEIGPTGQKIISGAKTFGTVTGKILSSKVGQYSMKYGMYGALETPALIEVSRNNPEMLGATIGKSLTRWEITWGAMDLGIGRPGTRYVSPKTEPDVFVGTPVTEDVFMRDVQKNIQTSTPQVTVTGDRTLAEFGIEHKYTIIEEGQQTRLLQGEGVGRAEIKLQEFKGFTPHEAGQPRTTFTGYIATSDKPVVIQTGMTEIGMTDENFIGRASTRLHPSLEPGQELFISEKRSLVFGTSTTEVTTKTGLLSKEEKIIVSDFKGLSEEPMQTGHHYRIPRLEEPGISSKYYLSELKIKPRTGEELTVTGMGSSREGFPALVSTEEKGQLIVTQGSRAKTEFIGEISPRQGQQYEKNLIREYGDVYYKQPTGEANANETGISGGDISVIRPGQLLRMEQIEGVQIKVQRSLSGGSGALKLLAEKETTKTITKLGTKEAAIGGGILLGKAVEEKTNENVIKEMERDETTTEHQVC